MPIIYRFEIAVEDFERAKLFYEDIFSIHMTVMQTSDTRMALFPTTDKSDNASGALCCGKMYDPGASGTIVYFNANPDLLSVLDKVEHAGGDIIMGKSFISDSGGYMAIFLDSEGNRIALHSIN